MTNDKVFPTLRSFFGAAVACGLLAAAPVYADDYESVASGSWFSASNWQNLTNPMAGGFPSAGDNAFVRAGHSMFAGFDLTIEDLQVDAGGQVTYSRDFDVNDVTIAPADMTNPAGVFTSGSSASLLLFRGDGADAASFNGAPASVGTTYIVGPGTAINSPNGNFVLNGPLTVSSWRVQPGGTVTITELGSLDGVPPNPLSSRYFWFEDTTLIYTGPITRSPGDEWLDTANAPTDNSPEAVEVRGGTTVDISASAIDYLIGDSLTVGTDGVFIAPDDDVTVSFLVLDGAMPPLPQTVFLEPDGIIQKTKTSASSEFPSGNFDFGLAFAKLDFPLLDFTGAVGTPQITVQRVGNEPGGPAPNVDGTLTQEHYVFDTNATNFILKRVELYKPPTTVFTQFPVICRRDSALTFNTCLASSLTTETTNSVVYESPAMPASNPTDITSFDQDLYFVHDANRPTLVDLVSFEAVPTGLGGSVNLVWETAAEIENVGFHVYTIAEDGLPVRLNDSLITAQGTPWAGSVYSFEDARPLRHGEKREYILEDVDRNGIRTSHGPVSVEITRNGGRNNWSN